MLVKTSPDTRPVPLWRTTDSFDQTSNSRLLRTRDERRDYAVLISNTTRYYTDNERQADAGTGIIYGRYYNCSLRSQLLLRATERGSSALGSRVKSGRVGQQLRDQAAMKSVNTDETDKQKK